MGISGSRDHAGRGSGKLGQLYRDRGDGENVFDELKNQWGWGGFVTHDLARCRLAARLVALFYDWWNIFTRLAEPDRHREAITSRPLLLHAIAERVRHARQTTIKIASTHAKSVPAAKALRAAFQAFLKGRALRAPPRLCPSSRNRNFFRDTVGVAEVSKEALSQRTNDYQRWVEAYARNPFNLNSAVGSDRC